MSAQLLSLEYGVLPPAAAAVPRYAAATPGASGGSLTADVALAGCGVGCTLRPTPVCPASSPAQCGPQFALLVAANATDPAPAWYPATGAMVNGTALRLTVAAAGVPVASAYGRGNWPLVSLYAGDVPVLPWCFTLGRTVDVPCYVVSM